MILETCAILAVLFFAVLTFFLIQTLRRTQKTLKALETSLYKFDERLAPTVAELNQTLHQTHHLLALVKNRVETLDPLFSSVQKVGQIFNNLKFLSNSKEDSLEENKENQKIKVLDLMEIFILFAKIAQQIKKRR